MGATETAWRLLQYPLLGKSHCVERLPIHLPLGQNVLFEDGDEQGSIDRALRRTTKLEAWFALNLNCDKFGPDVLSDPNSRTSQNHLRHTAFEELSEQLSILTFFLIS